MVVHLHKGGDTSELDKYRPVSKRLPAFPERNPQ